MEVKIGGIGVGFKGPSVDLNWTRGPPRVLLIGDEPKLDPVIIRNFRAEGYQISYLRYNGDRPNFGKTLEKVAEPLELGEKYAIVGAHSYTIPYGRAKPPLLTDMGVSVRKSGDSKP
jgi:hypothetical protein